MASSCRPAAIPAQTTAKTNPATADSNHRLTAVLLLGKIRDSNTAQPSAVFVYNVTLLSACFIIGVIHYNLFTSKKLFDMLQTKLRDVDVAAFDGAIDGDQLVLDIVQSNGRLPHQTVLVRLAACADLAEEVREPVHYCVPPDAASTMVDHSQSRSASICAAVRSL